MGFIYQSVDSGNLFMFVAWMGILFAILYSLRKIGQTANRVLFTKEGEDELLHNTRLIRLRLQEYEAIIRKKAQSAIPRKKENETGPRYVKMSKKAEKDHQDLEMKPIQPLSSSFVENMRFLDQ